MFSMCSELTPRARIPDTRIPQLMQPCHGLLMMKGISIMGEIPFAGLSLFSLDILTTIKRKKIISKFNFVFKQTF